MRTLLIVGTLLMTAQPALAQTTGGTATRPASSGPTLFVRADSFSSQTSSYTDTYGQGLTYGGELRIPVPLAGGRVALTLEGNNRTADGSLSLTGESTTITVTGAEAGIRFQFTRGRLAPAVGGGILYASMTERSEALGEARASGIGGFATVGLTWSFARHLCLDARVKYTTAKVQPDATAPDEAFRVDVGGLAAGFGLGVRF